MDRLQVFQHRGGLARTLGALKSGAVTLGFIGGSITDPRPGYTWPEPVIAWFASTFPGVRIAVENAAIGATGSELAVFRARRDLIGRGCDVVFVEFAVNDSGEPADKRMRTREGLLRKLLAREAHAGDGARGRRPRYRARLHLRAADARRNAGRHRARNGRGV